MATINEAIEIVKDRHYMSVLEEGTVTELGALKTKKFLTENLNIIKKILVEEGVVDGAKAHLANNWGKYAAGAAGTAGLVGLAVANGGPDGSVLDRAQEGATNAVHGNFGQLSNNVSAAKNAVVEKVQGLFGGSESTPQAASTPNPVDELNSSKPIDFAKVSAANTSSVVGTDGAPLKPVPNVSTEDMHTLKDVPNPYQGEDAIMNFAKDHNLPPQAVVQTVSQIVQQHPGMSPAEALALMAK